MEYTLTEQQKNNLLIFLDRVTLTPKEIPAYVDIIKSLTEERKEE